MLHTPTRRSIPAGLLLLALGACAGMPSVEDVNRANVGDPPAQADAEAQVRKWLDEVLKDPESARVTFGRLGKGSYKEMFSAPRFAWELSFTCNAKNSFGAYTGSTPMSGFFLSGKLVAIWDGGQKKGNSVTEFGGGGRTAEEAGLE